MKTRIKVETVEPGMFSTERYVAFEVDGKEYALFVDQASIQDHALEVQVVESYDDRMLIELPRDTFNAGSRVYVPREALLTA